MVAIVGSILICLFSLALFGAGVDMILDEPKRREFDCVVVGAIVLVAAVAGLVIAARIAMGVL